MNSSLSDADVRLLIRELFEQGQEETEDGTTLLGIDYLEDHSLSLIWLWTDRFGPSASKRRDAFLWILDRLLRMGRIRLHKNGAFFNTPIEQQIDMFREAWPGRGRPYAITQVPNVGLWFFDPDCPAGIAWLQIGGYYAIAK